MEGNDGELVIYDGSSFGFMEIGKVRGNATECINVNVGDKLDVRKID